MTFKMRIAHFFIIKTSSHKENGLKRTRCQTNFPTPTRQRYAAISGNSRTE
jgi:predicted AlkP superfamily pyrophosphatase or phosphodiesterase